MAVRKKIGRIRRLWREVKLLRAINRNIDRPSLADIVDGTVSQHLRSNPEYRANRYPPLVRLMGWTVANPWYSIVIVANLYLTVLVLSGLGWIPNTNLSSDKQADFRDFWTVNIGLLAVQASLIGVVFPLVIAFVGFLNQGRASFASRLTIYITSSRALFVGLSSIVLCVVLLAQLLFAEQIDHASGTVTALNFGWFSINAFALAYFVLQTIAFLHPAQRAPIMRAYVANVVWPREIVSAITAIHWAKVVSDGHLPGGDEINPLEPESAVYVRYSGMWNAGDPRVSRHLSRKMVLVDVKFGILAPVIEAWLREAKQLNEERVHDFVVPLHPGLTSEGQQVLVGATLPLSLIGRVAVKLAFEFRRQPSENGSIRESSRVLSEMIADLLVLIDSRQASEFAEQIRDVIDFHSFLYLLAQSTDDQLNYAQFASGQKMFSQPLSDEWMGAYLDLIRRVVEGLSDQPEFIRPMAYLPSIVYAKVSSEVTPEVLRPLIRLGEFLAFETLEWAVSEFRLETTPNTGDQHTFTLLRHGEAHERAWREQVAGWERLLDVIAEQHSRRDSRHRSWKEITRISDNIDAHLRSTTQMAARAIRGGDALSTSWTIDLLLHWNGQLKSALSMRRSHGRLQAELLTLETFKQEWEEIEKLQLSPGREFPSAEVVFSAVIENLWRDNVFVLVSLCLHWSIRDRVGATTTQAARMLLKGEYHDQGAARAGETRDLSGEELLISGLRIVGSGERFSSNSYAAHINRMIEVLSDVRGAPRVAQRIYSSIGGASFSDLSQAQAIAIMATTSFARNPDARLRRLLTQAEDNALRRMEEYTTSLLSALDELNADQHQPLLSALIDEGDEVSFDDRRDYARQLVEQSRSILTGHRAAAIQNAAIDFARVELAAKAAASKAFAGDDFPRHLFNKIAPTTEPLNEFTLSLGAVNKGEFTNPPMTQAAFNEEEWWQETMSNQVATVLWSDILRGTQFHEIDGQTPEEFWHAIREGSAKIREKGHDPFLVIDSGNCPEWLSDWQLPDEQGGIVIPKDLIISRDEDQVPSYDYSMNDTPVYSAPTDVGVVYLLSTQLLSSLRFHTFDNELSIYLRFEPDSDNPWLGTMHASFQREVELADLKGYRIRWSSGSIGW